MNADITTGTESAFDLKIRIISMCIVHKPWLKSKLQILLNSFSYLLPNSIRANWRYNDHRTYRQEEQSDLVLLIFFPTYRQKLEQLYT